MKKSLHMFSNKKPCRIQVVLGLCLAMLFTFLIPSYKSYGSNSEVHYGYFGENSVPALGISYNTSLGLDDLINLGITSSYSSNTDLINLNVTYQNFISSIQYYNLNGLLSNWQAGNPSYFVNISYVTRSSSSAFVLYFSKSNGKNTFVPEAIGDNEIQINNSKDIYFSYSLDLILQDYSILGTTNSKTDQNHAKNVFVSGTISSSTSYSNSFYSNGASYNFSYGRNTDSITVNERFTEFLNSYDFYVYCVVVPDISVENNSASLQYYRNISFKRDNISIEYPLFSTIFSYDLGSDLIYSYENVSTNYKFALPTLSRFSSAVIIQDKSDVMSYGYEVIGDSYVTPTPVPTYSWGTPTPFPNVTFIPATLTPIVVPYDPYIIGSDDTWDNLAGYMGILNTALKSPVNRFFSDVMQVTYSFNDWFKFILVVPIICLFAFIIGRLKRK